MLKATKLYVLLNTRTLSVLVHCLSPRTGLYIQYTADFGQNTRARGFLREPDYTADFDPNTQARAFLYEPNYTADLDQNTRARAFLYEPNCTAHFDPNTQAPAFLYEPNYTADFDPNTRARAFLLYEPSNCRCKYKTKRPTKLKHFAQYNYFIFEFGFRE